MIFTDDCEDEIIYFFVIMMDYRNFPVFLYYHI